METSDLPHLTKWFKAIEARPAVQKGLNIPEPNKFSGKQSEEEVQVRLFAVPVHGPFPLAVPFICTRSMHKPSSAFSIRS